MAIYLAQEFINGMSFPLTEELSDQQMSNLKFGLVYRLPFTAGLYPYLKRAGAEDYHRSGTLDFETLEKQSLKDPNATIALRRSGNLSYIGKRWYYFHQLGTEEGAHGAYVELNGVPEFPVEPQNLTLAEYHATDIEFDGLLWRIKDAEEMKKNPSLSSEDKDAISLTEALLREQFRQSQEIRQRRGHT